MAKVEIGEVYHKRSNESNQRKIVGVSADGKYLWYNSNFDCVVGKKTRNAVSSFKSGWKKMEGVNDFTFTYPSYGTEVLPTDDEIFSEIAMKTGVSCEDVRKVLCEFALGGYIGKTINL